MPKVKYTTAKGLYQESGAGTPGLLHGIQPSDIAGTTSAADSLAIPLTHTVVTKTTGADAEALTLADGDAGDRASLYFVNSTVGWIVLGLSGVAAPPVTTV